jgi:uncharacterized membrane protein (DUF373 family)
MQSKPFHDYYKFKKVKLTAVTFITVVGALREAIAHPIIRNAVAIVTLKCIGCTFLWKK